MIVLCRTPRNVLTLPSILDRPPYDLTTETRRSARTRTVVDPEGIKGNSRPLGEAQHLTAQKCLPSLDEDVKTGLGAG